MTQYLIVVFACLETQIALGEPTLAEKHAAENAAIKKESESWNAPVFSPIWGGIFVEPIGENFQAPSGATSAGICRS